MTDPNIVTRQELAALIGARSPSYINELEKNGRAVRAPDGKNWLKAESLQAYRAGRDPSKQGVADRWAAERAKKPLPAAQPASATDTTTDTQTDAAPDPESDPAEPSSLYNFQDSKAKREHWAAEREHSLFQKEAGLLMERSAVVSCFAEAGATLRSKLESWQTTLPPQLAGRDESAIRITIADQVEQLLLDLVDTFSRMASQAE